MNKIISSLAFAGSLFVTAAASDSMQTCMDLVKEALGNLHEEAFSAEVGGVKWDPLQGEISWTGHWEFRDTQGERTFTYKSPAENFTHRSRNYGREQWMEDAQSGRVRRIGNRQWRKFAVNGVLTYEDLVKMPTGYLAEAGKCTQFRESDSTYHLTVKVEPAYQSNYSKLEVTLGKRPVLPLAVAFFDWRGEEQKVFEIGGFQSVGSKWVFSRIDAFGQNSPAGLSLHLARITLPDEEPSSLEPEIKIHPSGFYWILSHRRDMEKYRLLEDLNAAVSQE